MAWACGQGDITEREVGGYGLVLGLPPPLEARLFPGMLGLIENSPVAWGVGKFTNSYTGYLQCFHLRPRVAAVVTAGAGPTTWTTT